MRLGINEIKTAGLLGLLSGLLVLGGYFLTRDESGLLIGLALAAFSSVGAWFYSDQAALASFRAQPIEVKYARFWGRLGKQYALVSDL